METCECNCHVLKNNSLLNKISTPSRKKLCFKKNQLIDDGVKSELKKKKTTMMNTMLLPPKDDIKFIGRISKFTPMLHPENVLKFNIRKQRKN